MDRLEAMRTFVAIAERGSLSSAARALGAPVASVSRKLAALEAYLGARLVARSTRRLALTAAGQRYLSRSREILDAVAAAEVELSGDGGELAGTLEITAPLAFGRLHVLPAVSELLKTHPRLQVKLRLDDRNVDLIEEGIDVAVRIGALPDSTLVASRVGTVRRITCASPAYLAAHGAPAAPEDLASHDCIAVTGVGSGERWSFASPRGTRSVAVRARLALTTNEAAVDAAVAGLGVTRVLSYQAAAALASGELVRILERFEPPAAPVHLLHSEGLTPSTKVRAFVQLAAPRLRAALRA